MRITRILFLLLITGSGVWAQTAATAVPCDILTPALDAQRRVMKANGPDGKSYPVFRMAGPSPLVERVRGVLDTSFAQQALKLDRYARNYLLSEGKAGAAERQLLTAPMYLLMSTEEGGFARRGFWLENADGKRALVVAGYVDLVVRDDSVESGGLEEIFSHELGHLILRALVGDVGSGYARNMHQSMTVTDYPTAFDEGYAEHFQPLARDVSSNPSLKRLTAGTGATDLKLPWLSQLDQQLRTDGVKRNLFIHAKGLPASALDAKPDLYRLFVENETSTDFLVSQLKSGQQMMASEGVVATLFYRIVNSDPLRNKYREPVFYARFLPPGTPLESPQSVFSPYENVNLKLFAAMKNMAASSTSTPPMIALVNSYAKLFPDEAEAIYKIFIVTTWGATVSQELASALEATAAAGQRGDINTIRKSSGTVSPLLQKVLKDVAQGTTSLDGNLGPELWIVNSQFKIARAVWVQERTLPLTINLNTATEPELMSIPGVDLALARHIVAARRRSGFFNKLSDLQTLVPADLFTRLEQMAQDTARESKHQRE